MDTNPHVSMPTTVKQYLTEGQIRKVEYSESDDIISGHSTHMEVLSNEIGDILQKSSLEHESRANVENSLASVIQLFRACQERELPEELILPNLSGLIAPPPPS